MRATVGSNCCRSSAPSPFTGYSFHVVEAAVVFANEILLCFLLPMHLGLHRLYHLFTTIIHQGVPTASLSLGVSGCTQGCAQACSTQTVSNNDYSLFVFCRYDGLASLVKVNTAATLLLLCTRAFALASMLFLRGSQGM
jgi:hypothetical protein